MHELAIAQNIVDHVLTQIELHSYQRVETVALRIGDLTDIVPEALEFGFEVSTRETVLADTRLRIETVPIRCSCDECGTAFVVADRFLFQCPNCGSYSVTVLQGTELEIAFLEIDDGEPDEIREQSISDKEARTV